MRLALTRAVNRGINQCELTHVSRQKINIELARSQHQVYESCLQNLGCEILRLPEEPDLPDSVFVEDTAIVLDEIAIITRPGAESRRPEVKSIAKALTPYRPTFYIHSPGTVDGGDVLRIGKSLYVGLSSRTNPDAVKQIANLVASHGYKVEAVEVRGCLHLKSAVTLVWEETLLLNPSWIDPRVFETRRVIKIDPSEPYAANALLVGEKVIYPSSFGATLDRLQDAGIAVVAVDVSELQKAEGAVTCCSLVFNV